MVIAGTECLCRVHMDWKASIHVWFKVNSLCYKKTCSLKKFEVVL
jgi:hypothetical protein